MGFGLGSRLWNCHACVQIFHLPIPVSSVGTVGTVIASTSYGLQAQEDACNPPEREEVFN